MQRVIKLPVQQRILEKYGKDITLCPCCRIRKLEIIETKRFVLKSIINQTLKKFTMSKNKERTIEKE